MTNTILTDEQISTAQSAAFLALHAQGYTGGMGGETWDLASARAIESAVLAALVQRAGVEAVGCGYVVRYERGDTPSTAESGYAQILGTAVYPPEAIAQLQARIKALSAEVERLKNNPRQSAFGKESEKLADDYLNLSRAFNELLAERDQSKPAEQQGLFRKFNVTRVDGSDQPGGKHHGCEYFVLDVDHDQHAPAALRAYAAACAQSHPQLSAELIAKHGPAPAAPVVELSTKGTKAELLERLNGPGDGLGTGVGLCMDNTLSDMQSAIRLINKNNNATLHPIQPKGE